MSQEIDPVARLTFGLRSHFIFIAVNEQTHTSDDVS